MLDFPTSELLGAISIVLLSSPVSELFELGCSLMSAVVNRKQVKERYSIIAGSLEPLWGTSFEDNSDAFKTRQWLDEIITGTLFNGLRKKVGFTSSPSFSLSLSFFLCHS